MAQGHPIGEIKPSRRGTFRAAAKAAGRSVQEEATHVLNDPDASPELKRKANFAKNAQDWHHK